MLVLILFGLIATTSGIVNIRKRSNDFMTWNVEDYFLPDNINAEKYDIKLVPFFTDPTKEPVFTGSVQITLFATKPDVRVITLNIGNGLQIQKESATLTSTDNRRITVRSFKEDREMQKLKINIDQPLDSDKFYILNLNFNGIITNVGYGLFRGSYQEDDVSNTTRYYLGTQLRPVYARQVFPCLDEPKYKARFSLTVLRPHDFNARSNMPTESVKLEEDGRVTEKFQETPPMSTFLLTLFLFQFAHVESTAYGQQSRFIGWSVPKKINEMVWSQEICPPLVRIAEQYFNSPLYVPKMDQIALPQLIVIAMENWGINTYREENILANKMTSSMRQRQTVGRFTGHEILHHWIGDLVTLEWWDYLWIQEAFAMYFEYYFPNVMDSSWRMMDQFVVDLNVEGLHADTGNAPLTSRVVTPQEVTNKFMGLTYTKGPAIIRMLQHTIGKSNFQNGLRTLVKQRQFSTMTPSILWESLQQFAPRQIDLEAMMTGWTDQASFPVLFVQLDKSRSKLVVQQNDINDYNGSQNKSNQQWQVPVSYTTKLENNFKNTSPRFLITASNSEIKLDGRLSSNDWYILNIQFTGYYRVLYENDNLHLLIQQLHLNHMVIHPLNRAQLIDDIFVFADMGVVPYSLAFSLVSYLHKETEYVPLRVAYRALSQLNTKLLLTPLRNPFKSFMNNLLHPIYLRTGFNDKYNEEPLDKLNREQTIEWACYFDVGDCRSTALATFKNHYDSGMMDKLPGDIRQSILCYSAKSADEDTVLFFTLQLIFSNERSDIRETINALACNEVDHLPYLLLQLEAPQNKHLRDLFTAVIARPDNHLFAFDYVTTNIIEIADRIGIEETIKLINQLSTKTSLQGILNIMLTNLKKNQKRLSNLPQLQKPLQGLLNGIAKNEDWLKKHFDDLQQTLEVHVTTTAAGTLPEGSLRSQENK